MVEKHGIVCVLYYILVHFTIKGLLHSLTFIFWFCALPSHEQVYVLDEKSRQLQQSISSK